MSDLTFGALRQASLARNARWHPGGLVNWTLSEWGLAMCGEAGEAANVIKKLNRVRDGMRGNRKDETHASLIVDLGFELADTVIYADLVAAAAGIDLARAIIEKFNATSAKNGFPERLYDGRRHTIPEALG